MTDAAYPILTPAQGRVLAFVRRFVELNGYPPTRKDVRLEFGWSSDNSAEEHLKALQRKGRIAIKPAISRGITLL
jgi:repressor LexA